MILTRDLDADPIADALDHDRRGHGVLGLAPTEPAGSDYDDDEDTDYLYDDDEDEDEDYDDDFDDDEDDDDSDDDEEDDDL